MDDDLIKIYKQLHAATVKELLRRVKSKEAGAGDLNVARQMLRDQGITDIPKKNSPLENLVLELGDVPEGDITYQ